MEFGNRFTWCSGGEANKQLYPVHFLLPFRCFLRRGLTRTLRRPLSPLSLLSSFTLDVTVTQPSSQASSRTTYNIHRHLIHFFHIFFHLHFILNCKIINYSNVLILDFQNILHKMNENEKIKDNKKS